MHSRALTGWLAAALLLACGRPAAAADEATLLRVFLRDGSALVSFGELARIGDRVVFSMPTAATPNPPLHLVNLPADRVDWERTDRYARAAREAHYIATRAEFDYTTLSSRIAQALNELTQTEDVAARLAIAQETRRVLAAWPGNHYNYRLHEVRQMLTLLDEAIADLRAATGDRSFDFSLTTFVDPPPNLEPLVPPPTATEAVEQVLTAARVADTAAERTALLEAALESLERDAAALPAEWLATTRAATRALVETERRVDRDYQSLTGRIVALADRHARAADVRSLTRLVDEVHARDRALGQQRPEAVDLLVAAVQTRLDAARRLRLARDRWTLRAPTFQEYYAAIKAPLDRFARLESPLEDIKLLAGSSPTALVALQDAVSEILVQAGSVVPPEEFRAAHALLVSAVQLAANAARIRREAALADDIARAWDASSAAAGALMLGARARADMQGLLRPPELR